jgi:hypothetical protein
MSGGPNATQIKVPKNIPGPEYWLDHMPETISDALKHALIIDKKARALFPPQRTMEYAGIRDIYAADRFRALVSQVVSQHGY